MDAVRTVLITFRCEEETQSDYVSVTSDHVTDDHVTSGRRMCGANAQYTDVEQFRSDDNTLYVHFRSDDSTLYVHFRSDVSTLYVQFRSDASTLYVQFRSNDVFDATGFEATYQFYSPVQGTTAVTDLFLLELRRLKYTCIVNYH